MFSLVNQIYFIYKCDYYFKACSSKKTEHSKKSRYKNYFLPVQVKANQIQGKYKRCGLQITIFLSDKIRLKKKEMLYINLCILGGWRLNKLRWKNEAITKEEIITFMAFVWRCQNGMTTEHKQPRSIYQKALIKSPAKLKWKKSLV